MPRAEWGSQGLAGLGQEAISIGSWESPGKISSSCQFKSYGVQVTLELQRQPCLRVKG